MGSTGNRLTADKLRDLNAIAADPTEAPGVRAAAMELVQNPDRPREADVRSARSALEALDRAADLAAQRAAADRQALQTVADRDAEREAIEADVRAARREVRRARGAARTPRQQPE